MPTPSHSRIARRIVRLLVAVVPALCAAAVAPAAAPGAGLSAQQAGGADQAGEVVSMLDLALTEYAAAVEGGEVVNRMEYSEARAFTRQAREIFDGFADPGGGLAGAVAARLDTLAAIVERKGPVERYRALVQRASSDLAEGWGAVSVPAPDRPPSAARGAELYRRACAACHGPSGRGDGWAADGMKPRPPDLASDLRRAEATPARDYQVIMYGIPETAMPASRDWLSPEAAWDLVAYVQTLRFGAAETAEGKALALGPRGASSPVSGSLRRWSSPSSTSKLTDPELARRIRARWAQSGGGGAAAGASGGGAPALPDTLTRRQARSVVAYVRTLLGTPRAGVPEADPSVALRDRLRRADSLAAAAAGLARDGRVDEARRVALRGYMAFEGVEPDLRALSPGLVTRIEGAWSDLRSAGSGQAAAAAAGRVGDLLEEAGSRLEGPQSAWAAANRSFFIILREGFEAILIIGAVLAFLVKTGNEQRKRDVYWGVGAALAASVGTAAVFQRVMASAPVGRELLEGTVMLLAVAVLFSVSYWLISKLEHRKWEAYLRTKMQEALGAGGGLALAGVAFLAVYREGFESVIFYAALLSHSSAGVGPVAGGFAAGCVALAVIYALFTRYGVKIPMRPFFAVTSAVLYYMAVVFAGSGIHELQEAGVVGTTPVAGVPRIGLLGIYPTVETLAAQGVLVVLLLGALAWTFLPRRRAASGSPAGG